MNFALEKQCVINSPRLMTFWQSASRPFPVLIVGAGRWGRVWAKVIAEARGHARGLATVARHNHEEAVEQFRRNAIQIPVFREYRDGLDWLSHQVGPRAVWIVSRPVDHLPDALAALDQCKAVYMEKPLTTDIQSGMGLIQELRQRETILALGTEFALYGGFHFMSDYLRQRGVVVDAIRLQWSDPMGEMRHGGKKRIHTEVSLLADLWPHACSIFQIFCPLVQLEGRTFHSRGTNVISISLMTSDGLVCDFVADRQAGERVRRLLLRTRCAREFAVEFSHQRARCFENGNELNIPLNYANGASTLRLALGVLALRLIKDKDYRSSPLECNLEHMLRLQGELETLSPR